MKLSIETKVATAVAVAFAVLSFGAIAHEQSEHGAGAAGFDRTDVTAPSQMTAPISGGSLSESQAEQ